MRSKSFRAPSARGWLSLERPRLRLERRRTAKLARRVEGRMPGVRESHQREGHAPRRLSGYARQVRESRPGFSTAHRATAPALPQLVRPCTRHVLAKRSRHRVDSPAGLSSTTHRPHKGVEDLEQQQQQQQRQAQAQAQAQNRKPPKRSIERVFAIGARRALPLIYQSPLPRRAGVGKARRVVRMASARMHELRQRRSGCPTHCRQTPGARPHTFRALSESA